MHCCVCASHPALTKTKYDADTLAPGAQLHCYGCGLTINQGGYLHCTKCSKVQYCRKCKFCSKGHALILVIDLTNLYSGYANNHYSCNTCNSGGVSTDTGAWHCNACEYDLCPKCADV